jgi:hypothetical protein
MPHTTSHRKTSIWASTTVKITAIVPAAAITIAAVLTLTASHPAHATRPAAAAVTQAAATAKPATAKPAAAQPAAAQPAATAAKAAAKPESALAAAFTKFFRHQAADGMAAWLKTGTEARNEAILIKARGDAYPHRDAALPADSAALAASARHGLAHPAPRDTAGWDALMHDELTLARELPDPYLGNAATAMAPVILRGYLTFTTATA